jgi:hypothetical protein
MLRPDREYRTAVRRFHLAFAGATWHPFTPATDATKTNTNEDET